MILFVWALRSVHFSPNRETFPPTQPLINVALKGVALRQNWHEMGGTGQSEELCCKPAPPPITQQCIWEQGAALVARRGLGPVQQRSLSRSLSPCIRTEPEVVQHKAGTRARSGPGRAAGRDSSGNPAWLQQELLPSGKVPAAGISAAQGKSNRRAGSLTAGIRENRQPSGGRISAAWSSAPCRPGACKGWQRPGGFSSTTASCQTARL